MCRLFMADKKFIMNEGMNKVLSFLDHLERECGGDGNGYALIKNGKCIELNKAVTLDNQDIVLRIFEEGVDYDWIIYHTRVASAGSIKNENCHPYGTKNFVLAMNGTVSSFSDLAEDYDTTDTEMIYRFVKSANLDVKILRHLSAKFIGLQNGKVYATNPDSYYGGLEFIQDENGTCIASSFPSKYKSKSMKTEYCWKEGEQIEEHKIKYKTYNKYSNYYNDNNYDWYYNYKAKQDKVASTALLDTTKEDVYLSTSEYKEKEVKYSECKEIIHNARRMLFDYYSIIEVERYINNNIGMLPILIDDDGNEIADLYIQVYDNDIEVMDDNGNKYYFN